MKACASLPAEAAQAAWTEPQRAPTLGVSSGGGGTEVDSEVGSDVGSAVGSGLGVGRGVFVGGGGWVGGTGVLVGGGGDVG
jgi:hypothetical protein